MLTGVFDERGIGLQRYRERSVFIAYDKLESRIWQVIPLLGPAMFANVRWTVCNVLQTR